MLNRRVLGLAVPLVAVVALVLLLIFTLSRLAQIQDDMRSNVSANMLWVITQTQTSALRLNSSLHVQLYGPNDGHHDVVREQTVLISRLKMMLDGPQVRYFDEIGGAQTLLRLAAALRLTLMHTPLEGLNDTQDIQRVIEQLNEIDSVLTAVGNKTMIAQWEDMGSRLDHYRDAVLTIIFLMIGICLCAFVVSVHMVLALKRLRESEWLKRQSLQLQAQLDAERKISEFHRSFSTMISHQFRTPLAIIDASMQRLLRTTGDTDRQQLVKRVEKVRRATSRLTRLVQHTLIADQYVHQVDAKIQHCDLWTTMQSVVEFQHESFPDRVINILPRKDASLEAHCDPVLMDHILSNLVSNAIKYSPADTPITIEVTNQGKLIVCTVQDEGPGISDNALPRIFDRYYRAPGVASVQGTGIGLYVVRRLTLMQQGVVDVRSEPGCGTTFYVGFPSVAAHTTQIKAVERVVPDDIIGTAK